MDEQFPKLDFPESDDLAYLAILKDMQRSLSDEMNAEEQIGETVNTLATGAEFADNSVVVQNLQSTIQAESENAAESVLANSAEMSRILFDAVDSRIEEPNLEFELPQMSLEMPENLHFGFTESSLSQNTDAINDLLDGADESLIDVDKIFTLENFGNSFSSGDANKLESAVAAPAAETESNDKSPENAESTETVFEMPAAALPQANEFATADADEFEMPTAMTFEPSEFETEETAFPAVLENDFAAPNKAAALQAGMPKFEFELPDFDADLPVNAAPIFSQIKSFAGKPEFALETKFVENAAQNQNGAFIKEIKQTLVAAPEVFEPEARTAQEAMPPNLLEDRYIVFALGEMLYGFPAVNVREVERKLPVTTLPFVPHWFLGIASLRGDILPVIGLRQLWGGKQNDANVAAHKTKLLVLQSTKNDLKVGLQVDAVREMRHCTKDEIANGVNQPEPHLTPYQFCQISYENNVSLRLLDAEKLLENLRLLTVKPESEK